MPRTTLLAVLVLAGSASLAAAQNPDSVTFTRQRLAEGLYLLQGSGGNIALSAGKDGVFLIDDDEQPLTAKLKAAVAGVSTGPIRFVINTHWHGDHTGSNAALGAEGTIIVAQENVRQRMSRDQVNKVFKMTVPASPAVALPVVTFGETMTLYLNGDTVDIIHARAAHTDGDAIIHFRKANVIHAGDTFFNGLYPYIDVGSGGSLDGMIDATDKILSMADDQTKIIPGHGPLGNRAQLKGYRDMLAAVRLRFSRARGQGLTAEQVVNANLLADYDSTWGKGWLTPAQFAAITYAAVPRP
ncbi:MAG TPA: MBL fold metallo-hydrolase [Gemmatimonadales bacterium]|nr:MBL fold metallo-hydrolase [Gemmatimonadales bacterium]